MINTYSLGNIKKNRYNLQQIECYFIGVRQYNQNIYIHLNCKKIKLKSGIAWLQLFLPYLCT